MTTDTQQITRTLVASIVGRPNVGKSALANAIAGEKVAIVTPKPQTTRRRLRAVTNRRGIQYIFIDTPGFHQPRTKLGEYMVRTVRDSVVDVDVIVYMIENDRDDPELFDVVRASRAPVVLVINKVDLLKDKTILLPIIAKYSEYEQIIPISARTGEGVDALLDALALYSREEHALFPADMISDQDDITVVGELVREKLLICLDMEIPHGIAIEVTKFSERIDTGIIDVDITIYCERDAHKRIIIGNKGNMIKKVGELSRRDIERFMGTKVFLQTWVKVKENWRDSNTMIRNFGFAKGR